MRCTAGGRSSISLMNSVPPLDFFEQPADGDAAIRLRARRAALPHPLRAGCSRRAPRTAGSRAGSARADSARRPRARCPARRRAAPSDGFAAICCSSARSCCMSLALADRHHERRHDELAGLALALAGIERALDGAQQLRERERLLDEVERAETRGFHRRLDRAVTGHHDDRTAVGAGGRTTRAAA